MLTTLHLGNFKAFAETQKIPIKPLTLIFGPNSAGKSSLIHGLALANQAIETGDLDVYRTTVGGEAIDLGGFRQYIHRRNKDLNVEWAVEFDVSRLSGRIAELLAPVKSIAISLIFGIYSSTEGKPTEPIDEEQEKKLLEKLNQIDKKDLKAIMDEVLRYKPSVLTCEILGDGKTLIRTSRRKDGNYRFDRLEPDHPVLREIFKAIVEVYTTATSFTENDYEGFSDAVADLLNELSVRIEKFLPRHLLRNGSLLESKPTLVAPVSKGSRKDSLIEATKNFLPFILNELIQGLSAQIENEMNRFQYLGPLRSYPPRHIAFSQHDDTNWFAGGGYAWDVVRTNYNIRKKVNTWLGDIGKLSTPYELVVRHLLTVDDLDNDYTKIIDDIERRFVEENYQDENGVSGDLFGDLYGALGQLKNSEASISDIQELNLIDKRSNTIVSHRDVGIGISQVLPVLVSAYAHKDKIIAIEQPEIHLHPKLQAELGDVFIESALGDNKNTYILETHSEHLILRIMKRMRETFNGSLPEGLPQVKPSDISILYVEPDGASSIVREMQLNERGELVKAWPGGFFEEGLREVF